MTTAPGTSISFANRSTVRCTAPASIGRSEGSLASAPPLATARPAVAQASISWYANHSTRPSHPPTQARDVWIGRTDRETGLFDAMAPPRAGRVNCRAELVQERTERADPAAQIWSLTSARTADAELLFRRGQSTPSLASEGSKSDSMWVGVRAYRLSAASVVRLLLHRSRDQAEDFLKPKEQSDRLLLGRKWHSRVAAFDPRGVLHVAGTRDSTLLVRVEDVVLALHRYMACVPAVGFGLVGRHLAGRDVMVEEGVSPAAGLRKPLAVLLDEESMSGGVRHIHDEGGRRALVEGTFVFRVL